MAEGRRYTDDEVRAILEVALKRDAAEGVGHDELVAAAAEVGISRDAIDAAARELDGSRRERQTRESILRRRRQGFSSHLWAFIGVNVFLLAINLLTTPQFMWFAFPLLSWGLGLYFHARAAFSKEVSPRAIARSMEREEREARRAERRARKQKFEQGAREFGAAVEDGVGDLLSKLAREMRTPNQSTGARVSSAEPRQRIDVRDPLAEEEALEEEPLKRQKR